MIYLIQDCYKDSEGNYKDVLKVEYSKESFSNSREKQYNTHNYGYKFLGEREGDTELEHYFHKYYKDYLISNEWFEYNQSIVDNFYTLKLQGDTISKETPYTALGYNKTPKANDLEEYFELKTCQLTNKETGKRIMVLK